MIKNYILLAILGLPGLGHAQSSLFGLGRYTIGVTAPDSLKRAVFKEQSESYAKGTLTLVCNHIRTFKADKAEVDAIFINNLSLCFYDNKLFRLSCDYSHELKETFLAKYGLGASRPVKQISFCTQGNDKAMFIWGEVWQDGDIWALVVHRKGYNADCEIDNKDRLIIASQALSSLASDCDLTNVDPFIEEFDKMIDQKSER